MPRFHLIGLSMLSLLVGCSAHAEPSLDLADFGYLDVTAAPYHADPTGQRDATQAIQQAINDARYREMACFFPVGTYTVSDTLDCRMYHEKRRTRPCLLIGSVADPKRRATIQLAPDSRGFDDPANRRIVLYFYKRGNKPDTEANTTHYDNALMNMNIRIGPGNDGAVALRMQGAEGNSIENVNIDLTAGGHTGVWGTPGSGGSAANITVIGGEIGLDTRRYPAADSTGSQPTPTVTGLTLINQRDKAVYVHTRGPLVGVGWRIERSQPGSPIHISRHWAGEPFDGSLGLVDSVIDIKSADTPASLLEPGDKFSRSIYLENVYVRGAGSILTGRVDLPADLWTHLKRVGVSVQPQALKVLGQERQPKEQPYRNGKPVGDELVEMAAADSPPADLQSRHIHMDNLPTFETPGAVNVKDFGAVGDGQADDTEAFRRAVEASDIVFVPKGIYILTDTVTLKPNTKLVGIQHRISQIIGRTSHAKRFGGNNDPENTAIPMIRTADDANAPTVLAHLAVRMAFPLAEHDPSTIGYYAIEWRAGRNSVVAWVDVHPHRQHGYYPGWVARTYYKLPDMPDGKYPEDSMPEGKEVFCTKHSLIQVRGHGGGHWYNVWLHGGHMFREDTRQMLVENTTEPLHVYHLHTQQQESEYHFEARNAKRISIYGIKCELKAGVAKFDRCNHVRVIGSGGLGTPDANHGYEHLYLFKDTPNFLVSNIGEDINTGQPRWIGASYYKWVDATLGTYHNMTEQRGGQTLRVPVFDRPIVYLRGDPQFE